MNIFQESIDPITKKPVWSMRRFGSFILLLAAIEVFQVAAFKNSQWGFWSGVALEVGAIVLLFFTTWSDIKGIVAAARGINLPNGHGERRDPADSSMEDK